MQDTTVSNYLLGGIVVPGLQTSNVTLLNFSNIPFLIIHSSDR